MSRNRLCRSVLGVHRQLPSAARLISYVSASTSLTHVPKPCGLRCGQDLIERIEAFLGADCGEGSLLACPWLRLKACRLGMWVPPRLCDGS